jgi:hypothetical protein
MLGEEFLGTLLDRNQVAAVDWEGSQLQRGQTPQRAHPSMLQLLGDASWQISRTLQQLASNVQLMVRRL